MRHKNRRERNGLKKLTLLAVYEVTMYGSHALVYSESYEI
jgi:hypothetical protein